MDLSAVKLDYMMVDLKVFEMVYYKVLKKADG